MAAAFDGSAPVSSSRATGTLSEPADVIAGQGISAVDGISAFDQILRSDMPPEIIVVRGEFAAKPAVSQHPILRQEVR